MQMQMSLKGGKDQPVTKPKPLWRRSKHSTKPQTPAAQPAKVHTTATQRNKPATAPLDYVLQPAKVHTADTQPNKTAAAPLEYIFEDTSEDDDDVVFAGFATYTAFKCKECGYVTNLKTNLRAHIDAHRDEGYKEELDTKYIILNDGPGRGCSQEQARLAVRRSFKCKLCVYESNARNNIRTHVKTHEPVNAVDLIEFERKYETLQHGPTPKYLQRCKDCLMTFSNKSNLKRHMSIHQGEGQYQCTQCGARFQLKRNLSKHLHRHNNPFKCNGCDITFNNKEELAEHSKLFSDLEAVPTLDRQGSPRQTKEHKRAMRAHTASYAITKVVKPAYALNCCNPAGHWSHIQRIENGKASLNLEVPISLRSGADPYLIGYNSAAELKCDLRDAVTNQTAALMRLFKKMEKYDMPTYIRYDHSQESQYPLLPAQSWSRKDTCGFVINNQHYLYKTYKAQAARSLTTSDKCKEAAEYAERDPPIQGDWVEFYFTGYTFLKSHHKVQGLQQKDECNAIAFLAYCTAWELKGRPLTPQHTHDRIDNNRGYTFHNTVWANKKQQAVNRESGVARRRYRGSIQEEFQSPNTWLAAADSMQHTDTGDALIKKKPNSNQKNKRKRLQRD